MLPATWHKWKRPAITPANPAGTRFTYPGRMEGWVDLGSALAAQLGIEPTTAWSQVRRPNRYATESPLYLVDAKFYNNLHFYLRTEMPVALTRNTALVRMFTVYCNKYLMLVYWCDEHKCQNLLVTTLLLYCFMSKVFVSSWRSWYGGRLFADWPGF